MCYLRNFTPIQSAIRQKSDLIAPVDQIYQKDDLTISQYNFDVKSNVSQPYTARVPQQFTDLMSMAMKNTFLMEQLQKTLLLNDENLNQLSSGPTTKCPKICVQQPLPQTDQSCQIDKSSTFSTQDKIVGKIFGENKQYQYKLVVDDQFPSKLYKQRNFNIKITLEDIEGKPVRNSNMIHLCLDVCDSKGQWITESKTKEPLMKGKTQCELYHGEASFDKIYFRDVSRTYQDGMFNIVIYPKQSVLKYLEGGNSLEEHANSVMIQPLVIKDLKVKAKKKQVK